MRARDLLSRLQDQPFRPFRIHLSDGTKLDLNDPGMVVVGMSSAIVPIKWGKDEDGRKLALNWRTIALAHIVQFSAINGGNGKRRTRKSA
jgi:hypothetical protein